MSSGFLTSDVFLMVSEELYSERKWCRAVNEQRMMLY